MNKFKTQKIGIHNKPKHLEEVYAGGTGKYSQLIRSVRYEATKVSEGQIMSANSEEGDEGGRVSHKQDNSSEICCKVDDARRQCLGRRIRTLRSISVVRN